MSRYAHILTYLRSPPDAPSTLSRAIQLLPPSLRLEALLDLRDEAQYLALDELHSLCIDEISQLLTKRGNSPSGASVHSIHTLRQPSPFVYRDPDHIKSIVASVEPGTPLDPPLSPRSPVDSVPPAGWI